MFWTNWIPKKKRNCMNLFFEEKISVKRNLLNYFHYFFFRYELMDYQENVNLGYHPKSFIANKAVFHLDSLKITIRNEDLHNVQVLQLTLNTVSSEISQRPSAKHFAFSMTMEALTITGT